MSRPFFACGLVALFGGVWAVHGITASSLGAQKPTAPASASATDPAAWPRETSRAGVTVLMYQPQIERLTQNDVEARAAVQITAAGREPIFGAVWISAEVDVDRDARIVTFREVRVPRVRIVDASESERDAFGRALEREIRDWNLEMDLDRFIPLLDLAEVDRPADTGLKHDPPRIVVAMEPSTLVILDGPARLQPMTAPKEAAREKLERVVNTPALIVYHQQQKTYFLAGGGDLWYTAANVDGPYAPARRVSKTIAGLVPKAAAADAKLEGTPPNVIVANEPTELVVIAGPPRYDAIGDVDL